MNHEPHPSAGTLYEGRRDWRVEQLCDEQRDATGVDECTCPILKMGWMAGYEDTIWMLKQARKAVKPVEGAV